MKLLSKLSLLLCAVPLVAMAQTSDSTAFPWYMGVSVGQAHANPRLGSLKGTLDNNSTGYKIYGGYSFSRHWAAELEYIDMGRYTYREAGDTLTMKSHGLAASAVGSLPLNQQFSLFGKLGLSYQTFSGDTTSDYPVKSASKRKFVPLFGVGLEYGLTKNLKLRTEYDYFSVPTLFEARGHGFKPSMDLLAVGLNYSF